MGGKVSNQVERRKAVRAQKKELLDLFEGSGTEFPGSDHHPPDRKNWMNGLNPEKLEIKQIVWPGTHDSATNKIGIRLISRPFAQCQSLSIYDQLVLGTRVLDIRVQKDRRVCHGILVSYHIDVVIQDVKKFISETHSEVIILEIRTEYGHQDPPGFHEYLADQIGEYLVPQDNGVFEKTIQDLLPRRIICIWKPRSPDPRTNVGHLLWSARFLKDDWIDTDLPSAKFENNLRSLKEQPPVGSRKFFYRVENTVTPQGDNPVVCVKPVTRRIHRYSRLFIAQCFVRGCADRLQIISTDFIESDFVDACVGLTLARLQGIAAS